MQTIKKRTEGFTIIEVMIVLVIAAVILLIVFLAVPALQRNSRNTQRRNDVGRVLASLTEWTSNHNGSFPTASEANTWEDGIGNLAFFKDNDTAAGNPNIDYGLSGNNLTPTTANANTSTSTVWVRVGQKCNGSVLTRTGASARNSAAVFAAETGSSIPQLVCVDS